MNIPTTMAAVVLAGGSARRLGGVDKPLLTIEGSALLVRVLAAVPGARPTVVVGSPALRTVLPERVTLVREEPAGAGPVAAIRAGLAVVPPDALTVAVLAGDLPFVTASVVYRLREALGDGDVALLTDADGHRQFLLGVWRTQSLRAALSRTSGAAMRDLIGTVRVVEVPPGPGQPWFDCDTPEDLAAARKLAGRTADGSAPGVEHGTGAEGSAAGAEDSAADAEGRAGAKGGRGGEGRAAHGQNASESSSARTADR